ncbi:F-box protein At3g08750 [Linum grandiflorum]
MEKIRRLNRDIYDMVLWKLEVRDLLQLKCVSRDLRTLISDRSFKLQHSLENQPKLSGFFFQPKSAWTTNIVSDVSYMSVEREVPKLLTSSTLNFIPKDFALICSCNGLVCCKTVSGINRLAIHVGNPVTREWIKLDWIGNEQVIAIGMTFDPCVNIADGKANFKVVILSGVTDDDDDDELPSFDIYSSETGNWKRSAETCATGSEFRDAKCVSVKGVLYWLSVEGEVLAFDVESEVAFVMSAPIPASEFELKPVTCIGESNGVLQYIMVESMGLLIWGLDGPFYEEKWSIGFRKSLDDMANEHAGFKLYIRVTVWTDLLAFRDGILMLRAGNNFFLYNTATGGMDRVANVLELGARSLSNPTVLPYSMSLVPLSEP